MKLTDRWKLLTRAFNPKAQSYDAARPSIQRRFPYNAVAVDSHIDVSGADRERLMKLSRWLYNNAPFLRGLVNEKARYSVGSGIRPQARSGDEAWDLAAETFFEQWSRVADLQGRYTWREMQRIASIAIDRDGEVFFRATAQTTGYPALQLILAHRIGDARSSIYEPSNPAAREGGQNIIDGVVVNPQLRPIFYRYLMGDGIDPSARFEDIPAQQLIHVGEASQGDELRYVTPLAPSINHLRDVGDAVGFEKMAIKISSYIALAIKSSNPQGADFFGEATHSVNSQDNSEVTVESLGNAGGAIPRLGMGEDLISWTSNRPSQNFREFCDVLLREVCLNLGVPWEFAARPAEAGGAALRAVLVRAQRTFEQRQALLIDRLCSRVWAHVITIGMQRGLIPQNDNWFKVEWQRPAAASVDYGREAAANLNDVRSGLRTYSEDYSERGLEWKDQLRQRATEAKFLAELAAEYQLHPDQIATFNPNPASNPVKETLDSYGVAVRAGVITPNIEDERAVREQMHLPQVPPQVEAEWADSPTRAPITLSGALQGDEQSNAAPNEDAPLTPNPEQ
jgi:lambda family phage portal protein